MSRGPGQIERRIAELFAASPDRALSVGDIADVAFALGGKPASRSQRVSATRAAHRVLHRVEELHQRIREADAEAEAQAIGAGHKQPGKRGSYAAWDKFLRAKKAIQAGIRWQQLKAISDRAIWNWRATEMPDRRVLFHHAWFPVRVWAVSIQAAGVVWHEVDEIARITDDWVSVRYRGEHARFWRWRVQDGAWWRGVRFCSERDGYAARRFDTWWQEQYGHLPLPPQMRMPLADAMRLLGVGPGYTREDIIAAFRRAVKKAHPDLGGTAEQFRALVIARDRLLASLGTSEPPPKMPSFYPSGLQVRYRSARRSGPRLGYTRRIGHAAD